MKQLLITKHRSKASHAAALFAVKAQAKSQARVQAVQVTNTACDLCDVGDSVRFVRSSLQLSPAHYITIWPYGSIWAVSKDDVTSDCRGVVWFKDS